MKRVLLSFSIIFVFTLSINSATINVPADQPTIQAGIDASANGDTVLVAEGTYVGGISFNGKDIFVIGEYGFDKTIITGNSFVRFQNNEPMTATIRGFTFNNITSHQVILSRFIMEKVQLTLVSFMIIQIKEVDITL